MRYAELKKGRVRAIVEAGSRPHAAPPYEYVEIPADDPAMGDRWNGSGFDGVIDPPKVEQVTLASINAKLDEILSKLPGRP